MRFDVIFDVRFDVRFDVAFDVRFDMSFTFQPLLGSIGKQGSGEYDLDKAMRDLSDSLERENDLKEQLKYAGT